MFAAVGGYRLVAMRWPAAAPPFPRLILRQEWGGVRLRTAACGRSQIRNPKSETNLKSQN
jgi:hypothetical protein